MNASPPVTILVPTHDHAATLGTAVASVLDQDFGDVAVVIVADGAGTDTHDVIADLMRADSRVQVVARPKSPRTAEPVRHEILSAPDMSPIVGYLCDDSLMLPDHVSTMVALLEDHEFAHPLPILVLPDDELLAHPLDLAEPACVAWELSDPPRNAISLAGVMHTLDAYRRLPYGWRQTPEGRWTDHYMWEQFFQLGDLRAVTGTRSTTIKLVGDVSKERIERWWTRSRQPEFRDWWRDEVAAVIRRTGVWATMHVAALEAEREALLERIAALTEAQEATDARVRALQADLAAVHGSRSWRLGAPLRRTFAAVKQLDVRR